MQYVGALDQGTTSTRFTIVDEAGREVARHQLEHRQIFPAPGWIEHDPIEIASRVNDVIAGALATAGITGRDLASVGITNQRDTTVVWDPTNGKPWHNAIVWQDARTDAAVAALAPHRAMLCERTGLPPATCFSAAKLRWILDQVPAVRAAVDRGRAVFGTIDSWVIWNLTGGREAGRHVTDVTNASRTQLMNLRTLEWDDDLLALFGIPRRMLPAICPSSSLTAFGATTAHGPFSAEVPIGGCLGDQHAATVAQACFAPGDARTTYGTGNVLLLNTGGRAVPSTAGLLTTVGYALEQGFDATTFERARVAPFAYALEGSLAGLSRFHTKAHLARATLEAICFQTRDIFDAMTRDTGVPLRALKVDGGASANGVLMQMQADILGVPVIRPVVSETTALGAAYAAGLAVGYWSGLEALARNWVAGRTWEPQWSADQRDAAYHRWQRAVERSF